MRRLRTRYGWRRRRPTSRSRHARTRPHPPCPHHARRLGTVHTGADHAGAVAPERKTQIAESGSGTWEDFPCFAPRTGRCQFTLKGTMSGTPVADGTYYIAIDDQGAATPDGCVNAHLAGLFGDRVPDQNVGFVGDGQLCPDGAGGYRFESPFHITGGGGRFDQVRGSGTFSATLGSDHSSTVTMTGTARGIR